jgi:DNA-binding MarR family transcriptional regulator
MGAARDDDDLVVAAVAAGQSLDGEMRTLLTAAGHPSLRFSHRALMRLLVDGPVSIGDLADLLSVTQQAVSKRVAELERLGYVERHPGADARVRLVALTASGLDARKAAVAARSTILDGLREEHGAARVDAAAALLADLLARRGR